MQLSDYITIEKHDGVATIWIDQKGEKVNKVSPDAVQIFDQVISMLEQDPEVKAAVMMSRKRDFIAGADIEAFAKVQKPGDFIQITQKGHEILNRVEASKKPIVAAIHGNCLGGGLEIALGCHARIASNDASTKLALPEVQLGLVPGGGGTQRLPRLIGLQASLDMLLTGKNIHASKALRMGLVDEVVDKGILHQSAINLAKRLIKQKIQRKRRFHAPTWFLEKTSLGRSFVYMKARQTVMKLTNGNYPAPLAILDCVRAGLEKGMKAGLAVEAQTFERMILSPESRQLIHIFFAMTGKKKNPYDKALIRATEKLGILGAGLMGSGIAKVSIPKGIMVTLKDLKDESLQKAKQLIWKSLYKKVKRKIIRNHEAESIMGQVRTSQDYGDLAHSDMVIEAVFEDLSIKQQVIADTEAVVSQDCIIASNTSALPIHAIAANAKHPERMIGMHYFSPVPKMPLLEIVVTPQTADWVKASCFELGIQQGKTCIVVQDGPGFYTTRILAPLLNEALLLLEEGADILQIDQAMQQWGFPVGPVKLIDEVGIDVGAHVMSGDLIKHFIAQRGEMKVSQSLIAMKEKGFYGKKNHRGFYTYGRGQKRKANPEAYRFFGGQDRKSFDQQEIIDRCGLIMLNEAVHCLAEGIIQSPLDGDIGAIFGLGFPPFRGGPFRHCDTVGPKVIFEKLKALEAKHGNRFKPAALLAETEKFYL